MPSDIAIYGTLCALATLSRGAINAQVVQNETFGDYLEQEPYARELIDAYISSRFRTVLEVLDRYSVRYSFRPSNCKASLISFQVATFFGYSPQLTHP